MKRSAALVEYVSYYELTVGGKPKVWFRAFGDSLSLRGISTDASRNEPERSLLNGVWVNRYAFFPSCRGRVLVPTVDTSAAETLAAANRNVAAVLQKAISDTEKLINYLDKRQYLLRYYLGTHNVSDDGYNTMAAYSVATDSSRNDAERLLSTLKSLSAKKRLGFRHIEKYTLLHNDSNGKTTRTVCNDLTKDPRKQFRIIQTENQKLPDGAVAQYFHRWFSPSAAKGTEVCVASFHGLSLPGANADSLQAGLFNGAMKADGRHDIPAFFAPNGSPFFTAGGRFIGVTIGEAALKAKDFSFGFNDLLP